MIVATYGAMFMIGAGSTGFTVGSTRAISSQNPKSSAAPSAPSGVHRPKISAASAMYPKPELMSGMKLPTEPMVR